ncbi:MAG: hypothetical protein ABUS56_03610 [Acidobacteriota bacterium]
MQREPARVSAWGRRRRTSSRVARRERRRTIWSITAVLAAVICVSLLIALAAGFF